MNENRTRSILQRLPVILAVTATSYGLPQAQAARTTVANPTSGTLSNAAQAPPAAKPVTMH